MEPARRGCRWLTATGVIGVLCVRLFCSRQLLLALGYDREMDGSSPDVVAVAIRHAFTSGKPRSRYRVGKHATLLGLLAALLPDR